MGEGEVGCLSGNCDIKRDCLTSLIPINKLPPPTPPYTGGGLITKRFPLLCKEGLGEVVIKRLTFDKQSGVYR